MHLSHNLYLAITQSILSILLLLLTIAPSFAETHGSRFDPSDFDSLGSLSMKSGTITFDTSSLTATGFPKGVMAKNEAGRDIAVFTFSSISLGEGVEVIITGDNPIALLSNNNVYLNTTIDISGGSGQGGLGVAGGYAGGIGGNGVAGKGPGGGNYPSVGGQYGGGYRAYGDKAITDLQGGSGGAQAYSLNSREGGGGSGGGAIAIIAANQIKIDTQGMILSNGESAGYDAEDDWGGGGGSGGSILLSANFVANYGTLQANGGNGGSKPTLPFSDGYGESDITDGGSGGRIAIYSFYFEGERQGHVDGGEGQPDDAPFGVIGGGGQPNYGPDGSVEHVSLNVTRFDPNAFESLGTLDIDSGTITFDTTSLTVTGFPDGVLAKNRAGRSIAVFTFDDISIGGAAKVSVTGKNPIAILSKSNCYLNSIIDISGGQATWLATGKGRVGGYDSNRGPGHGTNSSGAGHYGGGSRRYGNKYITDLQGGSGGYSNHNEHPRAGGGGGGGAIEITVSNTLTIDPSGGIRANGGKGTELGSGMYRSYGGSGGSIVITCNAFINNGDTTQSGFLQCNGGTAHTTGGTGGRIAIYTEEFSGIKKINVTGSSNGTIFFNTPPVAISENISMSYNESKLISLNAQDDENEDLFFSILSQPSHGVLSGTPPLVTYTPLPYYVGNDSFTFKVNDGIVDSQSATISIRVERNNTPVASDLEFSINEDETLSETLIATDQDQDDLTYTITNEPSHGTISGDFPNFVYTPEFDYFGSDSFTYAADDWATRSDEAIVSITILPINDPPVVNDMDIYARVGEPIAFTLLATDAENDDIFIDFLSGPSNGELTGMYPDFTYTPHDGFYGTDVITCRLSDGTAVSNEAVIPCYVYRVNGSRFEPSDFRSLGTLVLDSGSITFDSSDGSVTGFPNGQFVENEAGRIIAVYTFDAVSLGENVSVTIQGDNPIAILSKNKIYIDAAIDASGGNPQDVFDVLFVRGGQGVAGGYDGGRSGLSVGNEVNKGYGPGKGSWNNESDPKGQLKPGCGGGYGGYGGVAFVYNNIPSTTAGRGAIYGDNEIHDLQGGSGGSGCILVGSSEPNVYICGGGAGGGAIAFAANETITIDQNGKIIANGGNGAFRTSYPGGGGSGGSILFHTNTLINHGVLQANGGHGGVFDKLNMIGGSGGGGRIAIYSNLTENSGTIEAKGGIQGYEPADGEAGTIYDNWKDTRETSFSIASILPHTGDASEYGDKVWNGVAAAKNAIDQEEFSRVTLEVEQTNNRSLADRSVSLVAEAIDNASMIAIVGGAVSNNTIQMAEVCKNQIPLFSPTATSSLLIDKDYLISTVPFDNYQLEAIYQTVEELEKSQLFVFAEDSDYGSGFLDVDETQLNEKGISFIGSYSFTSNQLNTTEALQALVASTDSLQNVVVVLAVYSDEAEALLQAMIDDETIHDLTVILTDGSSTPEMFDRLWIDRYPFSGIFGLTPYIPSEDSSTRTEFENQYIEANGIEPEWFSYYSYDAVLAVNEALLAYLYSPQGGDDSIQAIRKGIWNEIPWLRFEGVSGTKTFDDKGNLYSASYNLHQFQPASDINESGSFNRIGDVYVFQPESSSEDSSATNSFYRTLNSPMVENEEHFTYSLNGDDSLISHLSGNAGLENTWVARSLDASIGKTMIAYYEDIERGLSTDSQAFVFEDDQTYFVTFNLQRSNLTSDNEISEGDILSITFKSVYIYQDDSGQTRYARQTLYQDSITFTDWPEEGFQQFIVPVTYQTSAPNGVTVLSENNLFHWEMELLNKAQQEVTINQVIISTVEYTMIQDYQLYE